MARVFNFSAGPSALPEEVLNEAAAEMLDCNGTGQSVMEMSHRSKAYEPIIAECEALVRELLAVPENYKVLFLQGGASTQFAMIPLNLMGEYKKVGLINTGAWSKKAMQELKKYGECALVATSEDKTYTYIPKEYTIPEDIDYFYICENNTIYGTKYKTLPDTKDIPLVADLSSCIMSEPVDVTKYGMIFAGAQKNIGPAGLTVVIIREDLIKEVDNKVPTMLNYNTHANNGSMYNTPPTYAIYVCDLVMTWLEDVVGGLENMKAINEKKAKLLYDFLDQSKLFKGTVVKEDRSLMNVPFVTGNPDLDAKFVKEATAAGLVNLKGHRSVGGMRASIYNAMPYEGVEKLVEFMTQFEKENA